MPNPSEDEKRLSGVLKALGIARACVVDDEFGPQFAQAFQASRTAVGKGAGEPLSKVWGGGEWSGPDSEEADRAIAYAKWEGSAGAERRKLLQAVDELAAVKRDRPEVTYFSEVWPKAQCPLDAVSPDEFEPYASSKMSKTKGVPLLFIDLDLGDGRQGGIEILKRVPQLLPDKKTICVVLTNSAEADIDSERKLWSELTDKNGLSQDAAIVISKKLTHDVPKAISELRRAFVNSLAPELMRWGHKVSKEALEESLKALGAIDGDVLDAVVLQSSAEEGLLPSETLFRLLDAEYSLARSEVGVRSELSGELQSISKKLEALASLAESDAEPPLSAKVKELRGRELYLTRLTLGPDKLPIWLGDIWRVDLGMASALWVLIAPPCDIILRSNGKRNLAWVVLAEIKSEVPPPEQGDTTIELPYFASGTRESNWIYLKSHRPASADVLDAVALFGSNVNLDAVREQAPTGFQHVHRGVIKRMKRIYESLFDTGSPADAPVLFDDSGPPAKLTRTPTEIDFHIERVGRVESQFARAILQRYAAFLSRPAMAHDFAKAFRSES